MNIFSVIKFCVILFSSSFFLSISLLKSFEVKVLDNIESILKTNKMHVSLNPEEFQAVYKDNILFSLDIPKIKVKNWEFDAEAVIKNLRNFKNDKKAFFAPFGVQLNLISFNPNQGDLKKNLENSNLYISCLVVDNKGITVPKCFVKKLVLENITLDMQNIEVSSSSNSKFLKESKKFDCISCYDFSASGTFKMAVSQVQSSQLLAFIESKILLIVVFLLTLFSLYFFIPRKKEEVGFRFVVGIFLLSLGLIFLIKICLIKNYWPFDKIDNPEQESRVLKK